MTSAGIIMVLYIDPQMIRGTEEFFVLSDTCTQDRDLVP